MSSADYLFVGPLIVARIRDQVAALATEADVMAVEQLAQTGDSNRSPLAFVLWEGDRLITSDDGQARAGRSQLNAQAWTVLLRVRNADQVDPAARDRAAGPLLMAIHGALAGWTPPGCSRPLKRANTRLKPNYEANSGLYPLGFEILLTI